MFIRTNVRVYGEERAIARLEGIKTRLEDQRVPFQQARAILALANSSNFSTNGLPVGGWAPLDVQYGAWKAARYGAAPVLVRTGKLFRSLTALDGGAVNMISPKKAEFGTDVEYAKFHQYGTRKMPKRQIIFEPVGFAAELGQIMAKWTAREI
jgi:phage gpG-like protein